MKIMKSIDRLFSILLTIVYITMIGVVLLQIACRVIPELRAPTWTEEASRYLMVFVVALSSGLAIKTHSFVAVDTLYHFMNPRKGKILSLAIVLLTILFFSMFFVGSIAFFKLGLPQHSITMPVFAMSVMYFSMPLLALLIILYLVFEACQLVRDLREKGGK